MKYIFLAKAYQELENNSKRLVKTKIISDILKDIKQEEIEHSVLLLKGKLFRQHEETDIGISKKLLVKTISIATGHKPSVIEKKWKELGDLGLVAQEFVSQKSQNTLFSKELFVQDVYKTLIEVSAVGGIGSTDQKMKKISGLLSAAKPLEAKYIVRTVLQDLRIGVADGTLRDAIVWAYVYDPNYEDGEINPDREKYVKYQELVQRSLDRTNDFPLVALKAKKGISELNKLKLVLGNPIKVMLAQKTNNIKEAFETVGAPAAFDYKLDGFRMQIHKKDEEVKIFTRRLEEVTNRFPEVVENIKSNVKAKNCIIDCEAVGFNSKTGKYTPFQNISQRIKRKYDIEKLAETLPVEINVFDLLYVDNEEYLEKPFDERIRKAKKIIKEESKKIVLVKQLITSDIEKAVEFYEEALKKGVEGLMVKSLQSIYQPGSRVGHMLKLKPALDDLDLVIIKGEWGTGKRSGWLTSFTVACQEEGEFLEIGKVGTGLKEKSSEGLSFEQITQKLSPYLISEEGRESVFKPKIVVSLRFEEIQKSPTYSSGYALRFPRIVALREDKPVEEIAALDEIESVYNEQN